MVSADANRSERPGPEPVAAAAPPAPPAPVGQSSPWPEQLSTVAATFLDWLLQPRVRLTVIGATLLLIGALVMANSVWTLPLVIVGALMVLIAWIGRRLEGRFAVEWGETGTQLAFRAQIKASQPARAALARATSTTHDLVRTHDADPAHDEIIEGEAHTVEIEIAELEALIAAAETTTGARPAQAAAKLRVNGGDRASEPQP